MNRPDFSEEIKLQKRGFNFVAGLDEVGRGPLAGPVVAAAVCAVAQLEVKSEKLKVWENIKDSKKLTARQREKWYEILTGDKNIKWGLGVISQKIIDEINILEATKLAMKKALENLGIEPDFLLLDGNFLLEDLNVSQKAVTRGDEKIFSVAAASIIAKVSRDRLMQKYHQKFPIYGFNEHKGYGTKKHFAALRLHGPCVLHRFSFEPVRSLPSKQLNK